MVVATTFSSCTFITYNIAQSYPFVKGFFEKKLRHNISEALMIRRGAGRVPSAKVSGSRVLSSTLAYCFGLVDRLLLKGFTY